MLSINSNPDPDLYIWCSKGHWTLRTNFWSSSSQCKDCRRVENQVNKAHITEVQTKYNRKKLYDITQEQYDTMYDEQKGLCAICKKSSNKLGVDHNHETGQVRGLLCNQCNGFLGRIEDDPEAIQRALDYLLKSGMPLAATYKPINPEP